MHSGGGYSCTRYIYNVNSNLSAFCSWYIDSMQQQLLPKLIYQLCIKNINIHDAVFRRLLDEQLEIGEWGEGRDSQELKTTSRRNRNSQNSALEKANKHVL